MTYQCGIGSSMRRLGFEPCDPHIRCDGCSLQLPVTNPRRMAPYAWFLNGKAAPGWQTERLDDGTRRMDWCPSCKVYR